MSRLIPIVAFVGFCAAVLTFGFRQSSAADVAPAAAPAVSPLASITAAIAVVQPLSDSKVSGVVHFTQTVEGVVVVADLEGLTPGKHAFHIHEYGDCSDPKGMSAGGHYNPEHEPHGLPTAAHHHPGDMGNLEADADGKAHLQIVLYGVTIAGDRDPILGRSVIVHAKEDDGSQPTGNAGGRIGCGVIGIAKAK
jgi:superoxide dismutase, Cu-Zn family